MGRPYNGTTRRRWPSRPPAPPYTPPPEDRSERMATRFKLQWIVPTLVAVAFVLFATCRSDEPAPEPVDETPPPVAPKPPAPRKSRRGTKSSTPANTTPGAGGSDTTANDG